MTFTLNISLSGSDVNHIKKELQQTVTITQSNPDPSAPGLPVAWVSFSPYEVNQLTWEVPVGIYAATELQHGYGTLQQVSTTEYPADTGDLYVFSDNVFNKPVPNGGDDGTFYVQNHNGGGLNFGLTQTCMLNGGVLGDGPAPLSVTQVGNGEAATFQIESNIWVYLSSVTNNGTVISSVSSDALKLTMVEFSSVTLEFDAKNNRFKQATSAALAGSR